MLYIDFYHHFGPCNDKFYLHWEGTMLNLRCALQHHKGYFIPLVTRYHREIHPKHRPLSVLTFKLTRLHTLPVQSQSTLQKKKKQTKAHQWLDRYWSGSSALLLNFIPPHIQHHWQQYSCRIACIWSFCSSSSWVGVLIRLVRARVLSRAGCRCTLELKNIKEYRTIKLTQQTILLKSLLKRATYQILRQCHDHPGHLMILLMWMQV